MPPSLFDEHTYLGGHVMAKDYAQLLNQFNGKTEGQIVNMLAEGIRHRHWHRVDHINFIEWITYFKWLNSPAGAEAIRVTEPFTLAQAAMFSDFDMQCSDLAQSEKSIRNRHEAITLDLMHQLQRQRTLLQQELQSNRAHFLPASAYTPPSVEDFNRRCWNSYCTIHAGNPSIKDNSTMSQMQAAVNEVGLFTKREYEQQFLEIGIYRDLLTGYIQRKAPSSQDVSD